MAGWRIEFSKDAFKSYKKLEEGYKRKVDLVLNLLIMRDRIDIKPVEGEIDTYRLRVGRYRILIKIIENKNVIFVTRIRTRGDIYK